jgi:hypothetical protein
LSLRSFDPRAFQTLLRPFQRLSELLLIFLRGAVRELSNMPDLLVRPVSLTEELLRDESPEIL